MKTLGTWTPSVSRQFCVWIIPPFFFLHTHPVFFLLHGKRHLFHTTVASENFCAIELKLCYNLRDFSNHFLFLALDVSTFFCYKSYVRQSEEVLAGISHGQGGDENTAIYPIIFFPSQSPFIDFKDKVAGSVLKMDEIAVCCRDGHSTHPSYELILFPYFVLYMIEPSPSLLSP